MGLADSLAEEADRFRKGPLCTMCQLEDRLAGTPDGDALRIALAGTQTTASITRALNREGHHTSHVTVSRHRKGECFRGSR